VAILAKWGIRKLARSQQQLRAPDRSQVPDLRGQLQGSRDITLRRGLTTLEIDSTSSMSIASRSRPSSCPVAPKNFAIHCRLAESASGVYLSHDLRGWRARGGTHRQRCSEDVCMPLSGSGSNRPTLLLMISRLPQRGASSIFRLRQRRNRHFSEPSHALVTYSEVIPNTSGHSVVLTLQRHLRRDVRSLLPPVDAFESHK